MRTTEGSPLPTDYTFTGQKYDVSDGLMYYGARYYDATIGRFIQADTVVPNLYNPQDLNRYAYVRNNPLKYTDPTGHAMAPDDPGGNDCADFSCLDDPAPSPNRNGPPANTGNNQNPDNTCNGPRRYCDPDYDPEDPGPTYEELSGIAEKRFGVKLGGKWGLHEWYALVDALKRAAEALKEAVFRALYEGLVFYRVRVVIEPPAIAFPPGSILVFDSCFPVGNPGGAGYSIHSLIHELGHEFDYKRLVSAGMQKKLGDSGRTEGPPGPGKGEYINRNFALHPMLGGLEDWAESFAMYIYPDYYRDYGADLNQLGPIRRDYVKLQISQLQAGY